MTVYGDEMLTMIEHEQRSLLSGMPAKLVNPLNKSTPLVEDGPMQPTNEPLVNKTTVVTGRPTISLGRFGDKYTSSRASTTPRIDTCSRLMGEAVMDADELEAFANPGKRRLDEVKLFMPVLAEQWEYYTIYGDSTVSDKQFDGFQARRSTLGDYCMSAGGTAGAGVDLTSAYIANWGEGLHFIHPQNMTAGMRHRGYGPDLYQVSDELGQGDQRAYKDTFDLFVGLANPMDCDLIRIANIDMDAAKAQTGTQALTAYATQLEFILSEAIDRMKGVTSGARIYLGRSLHSYLKKMAKARAGANTWSIDFFEGIPRLHIDGIQCRIADQIGFAEDQVTA